MKIKKIGCQYFQRFGDYNEIEISDDKKIIGIMACYSDNKNKSNRAGKTSFVDMIEYALFGKGRAKSETSLINYNYDEDMLVNLTIDDIEISRGKSKNNASVFDVTNLEGLNKKDIQGYLEKELGISHKDFLMTYYFKQDDIHAFMRAGAASKKEHIIRWLEKSYWKELEKAAKDKLNSVNDSLKELVGFVDRVKEIDTEELKTRLEEIQEEDNSLIKKINEHENDLRVVLDSLNKLPNYENIESRIEELNCEINKTKSKLKKVSIELKKYERDIDEVSEKYYNEYKDNTKVLKDKLKELEKKFNEEVKIEAENKLLLKQAEEKLDRINKFGGICPITDDECKNISSEAARLNIEKQIKRYNKNLLKVNFESIDKEIDRLELILEKVDKYKDYLEVRNYYNDIKSDLDKKEKEVEKLSKQLKGKDKKEKLQEKYDSLSSTIKKLQKEHVELAKEISSLETEINQAKENNEEIRKAKVKINNLMKMSSYWKFITYMFSKNGIPSLIINEAIQEVQDETNVILEKLDAPLSIEFSGYKELKSLEERCSVCSELFSTRDKVCQYCGTKRKKKIRDDLVLKIFEGDKETEFEQDSGGGKVLISVAIRLAIMRMLIRRSNAKIKFIVLDEIFGALDKVYRLKMLELINDFVVKDLGIEQVFIISHTDITDIIEDVILITRHKNYSTFEWLE